MDFKNGAELLALCEEHQCPVSEIMKIRECDCGETTLPVITDRMNKAWEIMKESASSPVADPRRSIGGLIGGEAKLLSEHRAAGRAVCGSVLSRAITYACAVLEVNTSMGLIVAAPTAGSSVWSPGCFWLFRKNLISVMKK